MSDIEDQLTDDERTSYDLHRGMNQVIWSRLFENNFDTNIPRDLDFCFTTRDKSGGEDLAERLTNEFGYKTKVYRRDGPDDVYIVQGIRRETFIDPAYTDRWVLNMIVVGGDAGCKFDGWGVRIAPDPT